MGGSEKRADLARSTFLNFSGFVVPIIVQLVTVPLYIKVIGVDRYGVMALVWLLLGYFGVFDIGAGLALASRVAGLSKAPDSLRERVFWTGTSLSVLTGALGGVVLYLAAERLFGHWLAVPHGLSAETQSALPLLMPALPIVTGISALSGSLQGREAFGVLESQPDDRYDPLSDFPSDCRNDAIANIANPRCGGNRWPPRYIGHALFILPETNSGAAVPLLGVF